MKNNVSLVSASTSASGLIGFTFVAGLTFSSTSGSQVETTVAPQPARNTDAAKPSPPPSVLLSADAGSATRSPELPASLSQQLVTAARCVGDANSARLMRIANAISFFSEFAPMLVREIAEIECTHCDDGSLLVEIMLPATRIGFSFEQDESLSSWFIASMPPSPNDGRGYLRDINPVAVLIRGLS